MFSWDLRLSMRCYRGFANILFKFFFFLLLVKRKLWKGLNSKEIHHTLELLKKKEVQDFPAPLR